MTLYTRFAAHVAAALDTLVAAGTLPADLDRRNVTVEPPRDVTHGDLATNAAMVLAKPAKTNPAPSPKRWRPNLARWTKWRKQPSQAPASSTCA